MYHEKFEPIEQRMEVTLCAPWTHQITERLHREVIKLLVGSHREVIKLLVRLHREVIKLLVELHREVIKLLEGL